MFNTAFLLQRLGDNDMLVDYLLNELSLSQI